jgi:hypothetical protein
LAHEEGNFHSFSAFLANDLAIKLQASREGKDGATIAALHYRHVPSEEKTIKSLVEPNLFVPGTRTNIQFMVRTQKSTSQQAVGASFTSRTANLATRRS